MSGRRVATKECPRWQVKGQDVGKWIVSRYYYEGWRPRYRTFVLESVRTFETWSEAMAYVEFAALVSNVEGGTSPTEPTGARP